MAREGEVLRQRQHPHGTADEPPRPAQEVGHARMRGILRAVDAARLLPGIAREDFLHADHAPQPAGGVEDGILLLVGDSA